MYLQKQFDQKFIRDFVYAMSHGNSILKKSDKNTPKENGKIFNLAKSLVHHNGYAISSNPAANEEAVPKEKKRKTDKDEKNNRERKTPKNMESSDGHVPNTSSVYHTAIDNDTESDSDPELLELV
ncbi:hypothetical protein GUITHDRAFT_118901 [Guillardia theta CCMP2712]|uniref:Uncharacterized protein n=1 Tax=Guillardia theta (strain CCMP2712) TaxID=905079 RepID=L1IF66_GUITC|nr:hypothetical protein GUITHDRAFT_118901 [Guillardia theta CCMP2712]EKX34863.1 hypothetical protein GUITHDRAFT_118901 [Guillardia theta CCMP2712]|eukprot:XP_005821843.1 hypothetical protein GUITHDRAFT_118901 [Guillardia theta CCMP2712]